MEFIAGLYGYLRFSSELQSTDSNVNQQYRCETHIAASDFVDTKATWLADDEITGTALDRPAYNILMRLIVARKVKILIVAEFSRLGRADLAMATIKTILSKGGRFVSVREGIDTNRPGWQNQVRSADAQHSSSSEYTAARVRDGQSGRIRDGLGSAGDLPYGYVSVYRESVAARLASRSRVHRKDVVIDEIAADVIRSVFELKKLRCTYAAIVKHLIAQGSKAPLPRKCKNGWTAPLVRRILTNSKYRGEWVWGKTVTFCDGEGKKSHLPAKPSEVVRVMRPEIRIVSDELSDAVQVIIAEDVQTFGNKPGGKKRGPEGNFRIKHACSVTLGLIYCSECGSLLQVSGSSKDVKRLGCPKHATGECSRIVRVNSDAAERLVIAAVAEMLLAVPNWLGVVMEMLEEEVARTAAELPQKRKQLETDFADVAAKADRYGDQLGEPGKKESPTLRRKPDAAEARQRQLEADLRALPPTADIRMPDEAWVLGEMANLSALLKERSVQAMALIRRMIGRIDADAVVAPGKKRGFCRLRFNLDLPAVVAAILQEKLPTGVRALVGDLPTVGERVAFEIDLRPLLETEKWADDIYAWRQQTPPLPWNEIRHRTGGKLTLATCMVVYKRYCQANRQPPLDPPAAAQAGQTTFSESGPGVFAGPFSLASIKPGEPMQSMFEELTRQIARALAQKWVRLHIPHQQSDPRHRDGDRKHLGDHQPDPAPVPAPSRPSNP